jgi:hypothetical protein
MTENDFNSGPEPHEQGDALSATGMFLRAFDSGSEAPKEPPKTDLAQPSAGPTVAVPAASGPGEFTQMFQAPGPRQTAVSPSIPAQAPAMARPAAAPEPRTPPPPTPASNPDSSPGEFTRIFVSPSTPPKEQPPKAAVEAPPISPQAPSPPRMKGFSTPGVSDSASAEGSFTQFFKAAPSTPATASAPPPVQRTQAFAPAPPTPAPAKDWSREPDFSAGSKPFAQSPPPAAGGVTDMMSALSSPAAASPGPRQAEAVPYRAEPVPAYTPAPPAENAGIEPGGVTRMIQRLAEASQEAPQASVAQPWQEPVSPAPVSLGPGEFTRIISGDVGKAAAGAPAAPTQPAPVAAAPVAPLPIPPMPVAPAFKAPAPPAAPKVEAPVIAAPKLAPPAIAAPKSKLEAMVPILLVVNTFLLIVLLAVVIFAMKSK